MKSGIAPYRAGEPVWVSAGGHFVQATLASNAQRSGRYTDVEVAYLDGRSETTSVHNVYRDSPQMHAWLAILAEEGPLLRALTEVCQLNGYTYGGKACQSTPEWRAYEANKVRAHAAGAAALAIHPYER